MGGAQARRLCPQAVVVPPRMSAYSEASKAVFEVFEQTTPLVEGLSIDEAFLDVRGLERISGSPTEIAARLRREVRERVGLPITVGRRPHEVPRQGGERGREARRPARRAARRRARRSSTRSRSSGYGAWGRSPRRSSATGGSRPSAQVPSSPRRRSSRSSGAAAGRHLHALAHNRDPRRVRGRPPAALDRVPARPRPLAAIAGGRSTPSSSGSSTASPAACAPLAGSAGRSRSGCGSTTSRARPGRTPCRRRRRRRRRSSPPRGACSPRPMPTIESRGHHPDRGRARQPRRRQRDPARPPARSTLTTTAPWTQPSTTSATGSGRRRSPAPC